MQDAIVAQRLEYVEDSRADEVGVENVDQVVTARHDDQRDARQRDQEQAPVEQLPAKLRPSFIRGHHVVRQEAVACRNESNVSVQWSVNDCTCLAQS